MGDRGYGRGRGRGGGGGPQRGSGFGGGGRGGGGGYGGRGGPPARGGGRGGPPGAGRGGGPTIYAETTPAQLPTRLTDNSQQQLIQTFKSVSYQPERPLRPGFGTLGTRVLLRANFFAVRLPKGPYYEYAVVVTEVRGAKGGAKGGKGKGKGKAPAPAGGGGAEEEEEDGNVKAGVKRRIFELLELEPSFQQFLPSVAHDNSQRLVSAKKLPEPLEISVRYMDEDEKKPRQDAATYNVSIRFTGTIDLNEIMRNVEGDLQYRNVDLQPALSALNLIFQQHARRTGTRLGKPDDNGASKYFFDPGQHRTTLVPGVELWQGFFSSIRPAHKQLVVNVNVCYTAFMEPQNLADALLAFNQGSHGAMPTLNKGIVDSIRVKTKHLGYKKKLFYVGTNSARNQKFHCEEFGGEISVENYFDRKYKIKLRHPTDLPVVSVGVMIKNGRKEHQWVPAEVCDILSGCPRRGKLSEKETSSMIRYACNPPRQNAEDIVNKGLPLLGLTQNTSTLDAFGIKVDRDMSVIEGRVLTPPGISYGRGVPKVQNGSWNILDVKFVRGATVTPWWVLYVQDGVNPVNKPDDIIPLVKAFDQKCKKSGMTMPNAQPIMLPRAILPPPFRDDAARSKALNVIRKIFTEQLNKTGPPGFVLVLLEKVDKFIYPGIKTMGDVELGIHTLHMQLNKALISAKQDQYLSNVALKLNTKLGGVNHKLNDTAMQWLKKKPTMMVGIDVTHAGPGSREGTPSIAAVVASINDTFVQFPASIRIQKHARNKETLDELQAMLIERLQLYEKHNRKLPERVFIFRDGVSEGQFKAVLNEELPQVLKAFQALSTQKRGAYKPQLSIVVCGKRHHARMLATHRDNADNKGNTKPGTVVDRGVTSVFDFNFYLQAHAGLQGTVKSTLYNVIYDETRFSADEIQKGTNDVSYLYARATKAVSLIPPAYYADLACERGRCYLNDFLNADDDTKSSVRSSRARTRAERDAEKEAEKQRVFEAARVAWGEGLHPNLRETMFYI